MAETIALQVCYALPDRATLIGLQASPGTTLEQAIRQSGVLARHPEIDLHTARIGVYGKLRQLSDLARAGDRIEIYRPLQADPKDSRRRRARHKQRQGS